MGDKDGCGLLIAGFAIGAFLGALATNLCTSKEWESDCVDRGVAAYDTQTGDWKWTVERKSPVVVP